MAKKKKSSVRKALKKHLVGVKAKITEDASKVDLWEVEVKEKGKGKGTRLVKALKKYADETGKELNVLHPTAKFWDKFEEFEYTEDEDPYRGEYLQYRPKKKRRRR